MMATMIVGVFAASELHQAMRGQRTRSDARVEK